MPLTADELSAVPFLQGHLFADVSEEEKASRVDQLNEIDAKLPGGGLQGYLERARGLLRDAQAGVNPFAGLKPELPAGISLTGAAGPGSQTYAEFERLGMSEIGRCAFCLVAGGLGERLGYPGIKIGIVAEVTTGMTFIEMYCLFILAFQNYARQTTGNGQLLLPLAIMTSGDTHDQTVELMFENGFFGLVQEQVSFVKQEKVPALMDVEARISAKGADIDTKPHGHGDVHSLLHQHGLTRRWTEEGRQWLFVFQDTNPLPFRILCAVLGVSAQFDFLMNSVAIQRIPGESLGGICKLVDESTGSTLTVNVEYNQLDPLLKETPAGGDVADETGFSPWPGNINVLVFKIPDYAKRLEQTGGIVPEFVNPKWADASKTKFKSPTRLECMMQDFPKLCTPGDNVGMTQLDRWISKTAVKNNLEDARKKNPPECALTAEADVYECNSQLLRIAGNADIEPPQEVSFLGITAQLGARIILMPSFAISLEQMKSRLKGKIQISNRSALILDGNVSIDGLQLDGALTLTGNGTARGLNIRNQASDIVAIPENELASHPASWQIRGYGLTEGDMEFVTLPIAQAASVITNVAPVGQQAPFTFYVKHPDGSLTLQHGFPPAGYLDVTNSSAATAATKQAVKKPSGGKKVKVKTGCC
mmetsp:Transcript_78765/g.139006  ORF Transcript_78765/g.139006 Transcript_78765/m.139006 type:complete len:648 (+) Transcript_78765:51-1994(+)